MKTPEMTIEVPDEHIALMYNDGIGTYKIAEAIGTHQKTVYHHLKRMGIKTRPRGHNVKCPDLGW